MGKRDKLEQRFWRVVTVALAVIVLASVLDYVASSIGDEETLRRVTRILDVARENRDAVDCDCE